MTNRFSGESNITVKRFDEDIGALMVASDLVITKANYTSAREVDSLGIPQISVSYRLNPIDDLFAERIATNRALYADELDTDKLGVVLTEMLAPPISMNGDASNQANGRETLQAVARVLADTIRQLKPSPFKR